MQAKCNQFDAGDSWTERIRKKQSKPQKTRHAGNYFLQAPNAKTSGRRRCDIQGWYKNTNKLFTIIVIRLVALAVMIFLFYFRRNKGKRASKSPGELMMDKVI